MNDNGGTPELKLSEDPGSSQLTSILTEAETTISVSWSGGGQIKSGMYMKAVIVIYRCWLDRDTLTSWHTDSDEWSLGTLFRTAAEFTTRAALYPQRTWAVLTKYNNKDFVRWADRNKITIPQYRGIQAYTSDLLDMYMEYKANIARLQAVLRNPKSYVMGSVPDAISITVAALIDGRKQMQGQMRLIVKEIDILSAILSHISLANSDH